MLLQILQKEIAHARGVSFEQLTSPTQPHQQESGRVSVQQDRVKADGQADRASRGKRKYRRHPKVGSQCHIGELVAIL